MIRRLLYALTMLAIPLALTLTASPAHAVEWSPKTCQSYSKNNFKVCTRYYTTVWQGSYAVHYVELCLVGTGPSFGVSNTYNDRVTVHSSNGNFQGQVYPPHVDKDSCVVSELNGAYGNQWPTGGSNMEGTWTGSVRDTVFFDTEFSICRNVTNGLPCIF